MGGFMSDMAINVATKRSVSLVKIMIARQQEPVRDQLLDFL
jgi:hypothetical protein